MAKEAKPPRKIGRYAIHGEIASGGMATVHFGRLLGPVGFSRTVAIKRLHPAFASDPEFVSMFLDEARLVARIRHPNVVPTVDVVATDGELFLVMDYVQGESLARLTRELRERGEAIPFKIAASIMSGCLQGLHAAHEAQDERGMGLGIVHRDVSPQNIIIGVDGLTRVLDFGVAKAAVRLQTTREGQLKGKLAYMAPEQFHADSVTRQVDIYAAAVVLWEVLTGRRLFKAETEAMVLASILGGNIEPPSTFAPGLPKAFDDLTLKGLSRNPAARFQTAREMALALEKCAGAASMAEVSEWLEQVAGRALRERAKAVAEIEESDSGSIPNLEAVVAELRPSSEKERVVEGPIPSPRARLGPGLHFNPDDIPIVHDADAPEPPTQSSISVSRDQLSLSTILGRRRSPLVFATAIGVTAVLALAIGLLVRRGDATPPAATTSAMPVQIAIAPPAETTPTPPVIARGASSGSVSPSTAAIVAAVPDAGAAPVAVRRGPAALGKPDPAKKAASGSAFDSLGGRE